jgi:hypothetical protein
MGKSPELDGIRALLNSIAKEEMGFIYHLQKPKRGITTYL